MKNFYLSAIFMFIFFVFNAFFQHYGMSKLYIIYIILLPALEEIIKFNVFKYNQFSFKKCAYLVIIFVVFEIFYKIFVIKDPFFGLPNVIYIKFFIVFSPAIIHIALMFIYFRNFELRIGSRQILFLNIFAHYMYNGFRNIIGNYNYYYFFTDSALLILYICFCILSWRKNTNSGIPRASPVSS